MGACTPWGHGTMTYFFLFCTLEQHKYHRGERSEQKSFEGAGTKMFGSHCHIDKL